jgi:hypothetical protein
MRLDEGRNDDARTLLRKSLAVQEASLGPDHPELSLPLGTLSDALLADDRARARPSTFSSGRSRSSARPTGSTTDSRRTRGHISES